MGFNLANHYVSAQLEPACEEVQDVRLPVKLEWISAWPSVQSFHTFKNFAVSRFGLRRSYILPLRLPVGWLDVITKRSGREDSLA